MAPTGGSKQDEHQKENGTLKEKPHKGMTQAKSLKAKVPRKGAVNKGKATVLGCPSYIICDVYLITGSQATRG